MRDNDFNEDFIFAQPEGGVLNESENDELLNRFIQTQELDADFNFGGYDTQLNRRTGSDSDARRGEISDEEELARLLDSDAFSQEELLREEQLNRILNMDTFYPTDGEDEALNPKDSDIFLSKEKSQEEELERLLSSDVFAGGVTDTEENADQTAEMDRLLQEMLGSLDETEEDNSVSDMEEMLKSFIAASEDDSPKRPKTPLEAEKESADETAAVIEQVGRTLENSKKILSEMSQTLAEKEKTFKIVRDCTPQEEIKINYWYDNERMDWLMMSRLAKAVTLYDNMMILLNRSRQLRKRLIELGIELKPRIIEAAMKKAEEELSAQEQADFEKLLTEALGNEAACESAQAQTEEKSEEEIGSVREQPQDIHGAAEEEKSETVKEAELMPPEEGLRIDLDEHEKQEAMSFFDDLMKKLDLMKKGEAEAEEKEEKIEKTEKLGFDEQTSIMKERGKEE